MFPRLRIAVLFILFALIIFPVMASAAAPAQPTFEVVVVPDANPATTAKGYFVYQLEAGSSAGGKVQLKNTSSQPITVVLDTVAAQTAQTGGSSFSLPGEPLTGPATWLKLDESSVTLAAAEVHQVGFSLQVPAGSVPGQYLTGISAYSVATPASAGPGGDAKHLGATITMQTRRVIGVEADVPGAWQSSLTITGVSLRDQPSGASLGVALRNDGATFIKPAGTMAISDANGKLLATQLITMSTFVPGTVVTYPVALVSRPANGDYKIRVDLTYDTSKVAHYENTLTVQDLAPAPAVAAALGTGPLDLGSSQPAPAASGNTAPANGTPAAASTDATPLLVIGGGVMLLLLGLVLFFGMKRRRTA